MREESEGNSLVFLLVLFIILSAFLCFYIVFNKIYISKNNEILESCREYSDSVSSLNKDNKKVYTIDDVAGYYKGEIVDPRYEGDDGLTVFDLYLNTNGTYTYSNTSFISYTNLGNYVIKDNTIILNQLYETASGAGKLRKRSETIININSKDKLSLMEHGQGATKKFNLILERKENLEINNYFEHLFNYEEYTDEK